MNQTPLNMLTSIKMSNLEDLQIQWAISQSLLENRYQCDIVVRHGLVYAKVDGQLEDNYIDNMLFGRELECWKLLGIEKYIGDFGSGYEHHGTKFNGKCGFLSIAAGILLYCGATNDVNVKVFIENTAHFMNYHLVSTSQGQSERMQSDSSLDSICHYYGINIEIINLVTDGYCSYDVDGSKLYRLREGSSTFPAYGGSYPITVKLLLMSGHYQLIIPDTHIVAARRLFGSKIQSIGSTTVTKQSSTTVTKHKMQFTSLDPKTEFARGTTDQHNSATGTVFIQGFKYAYCIWNGNIAWLLLKEVEVRDPTLLCEVYQQWYSTFKFTKN